MSPHEPNQSRPLIGLPEIDEQHRYLYCLFDHIEQSLHVTNPTLMKNLLEEIERYIVVHFATEEHLMRSYNSPEFATHQTEHEIAAARFLRFVDEFEAGKLNPSALRIFLTGWLMEHSASADTSYAAWIRNRRRSLGIRCDITDC